MSVQRARSLLPALGALAAILAAPSASSAQGTFEGMIAVKMQGMPGEIRYFQKGQKVRQEMRMEGMGDAAPVSIFDGATGSAITLMPMQKQYMKMSVGGAGDGMREAMMAQQAMPDEAPDFSGMRVTATGRRSTVAGIACEHYVFTSTAAGGQKLEICGARGMGFMGGTGVGNPMSTAALMTLGSRNAVMAKLAKEGFFPLKMTMAVEGAPAMTWEVTKVERKTLAASLFAVPAGYSELKMPGMPQVPQPRRP